MKKFNTHFVKTNSVLSVRISTIMDATRFRDGE